MRLAVYVGLIIATWIALLTTFFFNAAPFFDLGIFENSLGESTDGFYLDVTPPGWTFSIWGFIYTYQAIWLVYATVNIFRRSNDGIPLYTCAPFIHWSIFVVYIINLIASIVWLLVFDRKLLFVSLVTIALLPFTLYITTAVSIYGIYRYYPLLAQNGFTKENRYVLGFVSNAFAMYGTWVSVATLLNLGFVLAYEGGLSQQTASTIILAILTVEVMIWVLIDLGLLEKFTRFLYTPYIVLIVALIGVISKNYDGNDPNDINSIMLLIVVIFMLCFKICLVVYREMKMPAFPEVVIPTKTPIIYT